MRYSSTRKNSPLVSPREAVERGIAPDGGLYVPADTLPSVDLSRFATAPVAGVAAEILAPFFEPDWTREEIRDLCARAFDFPLPVVRLDERVSVLELFHGPTNSFKDFGARFLAGLVTSRPPARMTILTATSGDTGSAVGHAFVSHPNVRVLLLYPRGQVSRVQEQQITTIGGTVQALEVEGTFDDCQRMVKAAFADETLSREHGLSSANSINVGRWLPQMSYYAAAHAWAEEPFGWVCVPSGNLGNLAAGVLLSRITGGAQRFLAAHNGNGTFREYLDTGVFTPRPSVSTVSNAMDVGVPSNFERLAWMFPDVQAMRARILAASISDERTLDAMRRTFERTGYVADPHTAVGIETIRGAVEAAGSALNATDRILLCSTAHPAKFPEAVTRTLGIETPPPDSLARALAKDKSAIRIPATLDALRGVLADR